MDAGQDAPPAKPPIPQSKDKWKGSLEQRFTVRSPEWHYLQLQMTFNPPHPADFTSPSYPPDLLTWKTHLDAALGRFLGISGTGIPADFLHLDADKLLVRIPHEDAPRYMAAVSGWGDEIEGRTVGFRVFESAEFLMGIVGGDGSGLFR